MGLCWRQRRNREDVDFAFVSLDYYNRYHDFIRGMPGSFNEVIKGIDRIRKAGNTKVVLVTTISSLNFSAIEPMAQFAKDLHVGISFNSVEPTVQAGFEQGRTSSPVSDYGLTKSQLQFFYDTLLKLKQQGFPLMETENVLKHFVEGRSWSCQFPKMFVFTCRLITKFLVAPTTTLMTLTRGLLAITFQANFSGITRRELPKM